MRTQPVKSEIFVPVPVVIIFESQYELDILESIVQAMAPLNSTLGSITPKQYEYMWKLVLALRNAAINNADFSIEVSNG